MQFLYEKLNEEFGRRNIESIEMPNFLVENLNPAFSLREYQESTFKNFICYFERSFDFKEIPIHLLFNMATGSGKTLIMAGLILYLYERGYNNFLFFVNSTNIIEKTKDNFLNNLSQKYLFNQKIVFNNKEVKISPVVNFEAANRTNINICFTTIQKLHTDLINPKENSLTFEDFKNKKIVYKVLSGKGIVEAVFTQSQVKENLPATKIASDKTTKRDFALKEISPHIIKTALAKNDFFSFSNLKIYFPKLKSQNEFILSENYLAGFCITFEGLKRDLDNLEPKEKLNAVLLLLGQIEKEIKANIQSEGKKYKIIGLPFYSKIKENEFKAVFHKNV
ncbi:MAG: DEAD/DEAH box helicase family protein [bacterium]|nr:DEAD/DEAH box helicase family protein [bacterium]